MPEPAEVEICGLRAAPALSDIVVAHAAPLGTPKPRPRAVDAGNPPRVTPPSVIERGAAAATLKEWKLDALGTSSPEKNPGDATVGVVLGDVVGDVVELPQPDPNNVKSADTDASCSGCFVTDGR